MKILETVNVPDLVAAGATGELKGAVDLPVRDGSSRRNGLIGADKRPQ